jgi:palmitoyltransferase
MDHFCPWVGGVVGERSMKFFVQFLFYTMIFTTYITALFGFFVAEYKGNAHWFVALGLGGFFLLFTTGMMLNSLNMVFQNVTTIESVREKMYLAVILPPEAQLDPLMPPPPARTSRGSVDGASDMDSQRPLTSDLDDPCHQNYFAQQSRPMERQMSLTKKLLKGTITYPLQLPTDRPPIPAPAPRTFAIIEAPRGINPWSLGEVFLNFKAVFGNRPLDWFLPLKHSPCCDHSSQISEYPLGPEFEVLLDDAGLTRSAIISWPTGRRRASTTSPSRKRIRRLDNGWKNGERPDGWVSEKEARRIRKEWRLRRRERRRVENTKAWGR